MFSVPNQYRFYQSGHPYSSTREYGNNGAFFVPHPNPASSLIFKVIASDGAGWEHVSVSLPKRCPTWEEMAFVKSLFWSVGDCVVQFHPPESEYVNNHVYCLHLWRPVGRDIETPPSLLVGLKELGVLE